MILKTKIHESISMSSTSGEKLPQELDKNVYIKRVFLTLPISQLCDFCLPNVQNFSRLPPIVFFVSRRFFAQGPLSIHRAGDLTRNHSNDPCPTHVSRIPCLGQHQPQDDLVNAKKPCWTFISVLSQILMTGDLSGIGLKNRPIGP